MDWFLSALWDLLVICLFTSGFCLGVILSAIGWEELAAYLERRRNAERWEQILKARRELTVDELHRAERVERVRVFESAPEAVARAER